MRLRLAAGVAAMAAGAALAIAPGAHAQARWLSGPSEESTVLSCESVRAGTPVQVVGAAAFSEKRVDPRRQPRVGKTFYVRALVGAVGDPCVAQSVAVELVLPLGVRVKTSPRNRIDCFFIDLVTEARTRIPRSQGCPRASARGIYGGRAFPRGGPLGPKWAVPLGQALELQVPVRASRAMKGRTKASAGCRRAVGAPPCSRRQAGNHLQFAVKVFDGNANPLLVPHLGLTVRPKRSRLPI